MPGFLREYLFILHQAMSQMGLQIKGGKLCPQVLLLTLLRMRKPPCCCTLSPLGGSVAHVLRRGEKNLHLPWYDPRGIVVI